MAGCSRGRVYRQLSVCVSRVMLGCRPGPRHAFWLLTSRVGVPPGSFRLLSTTPFWKAFNSLQFPCGALRDRYAVASEGGCARCQLLICPFSSSVNGGKKKLRFLPRRLRSQVSAARAPVKAPGAGWLLPLSVLAGALVSAGALLFPCTVFLGCFLARLV